MRESCGGRSGSLCTPSLTWKPRSARWRGASKRSSSCAACVRSGQSTRGALRRAAGPPPPSSAAERKRGSRLSESGVSCSLMNMGSPACRLACAASMYARNES